MKRTERKEKSFFLPSERTEKKKWRKEPKKNFFFLGSSPFSSSRNPGSYLIIFSSARSKSMISDLNEREQMTKRTKKNFCFLGSFAFFLFSLNPNTPYHFFLSSRSKSMISSLNESQTIQIISMNLWSGNFKPSNNKLRKK